MSHMELATSFMDSPSKIGQAIRILTSARVMLPGVWSVAANLAVCHLRVGDNEGALNASESALKHFSGEPNEKFVLSVNHAAVEVELGRHVEAVETIKKALEIIPSSPDALGVLTKALQKDLSTGDAEKAFNELLPVMHREPAKAAEALLRAADIREDKEPETATAMIARAMQIQPSDATIWNAYGLHNERKGANDAAFKAYIRATELDPKDAHSYNNAANLVYRDGNASAAKEIYDMAQGIAPHAQATIQYNRAVLAFDMGDFSSQKVFSHLNHLNHMTHVTLYSNLNDSYRGLHV